MRTVLKGAVSANTQVSCLSGRIVAHMPDAKDTSDAREALVGALGSVMRERHEDFAALCTRLGARGITARATTVAVPVQLVGTLSDGAPFSLRARGSAASLDVWAPGTRAAAGYDVPPFSGAIWCSEIEEWAWPEAGWLDANEIEAVLERLLEEMPTAPEG